MPRVLIIAYGNPVRSDDRLGWRAAEELSRLDLPGVEIITCHQLTPELALEASQASTVIFMDAARQGIPGELISAPVEPQPQNSVFTHDFSPGKILEIANQLYGNLPQAFVLSLTGECFDHGDKLSPKIEQALPNLLKAATHLCREPTEN